MLAKARPAECMADCCIFKERPNLTQSCTAIQIVPKPTDQHLKFERYCSESACGIGRCLKVKLCGHGIANTAAVGKTMQLQGKLRSIE